MNDSPVILVLGQGALDLARRIKAELAGAEIHGFSLRIASADLLFDDVSGHVARLFAAGRPIIGLCAAGILIRALGHCLADKKTEPPVLAVAEDGSSIVPLLGGHRGANDLARTIAAATGGHAAITTAGDLRLGLALDDPPQGWRLAPGGKVKEVAAHLLAGGAGRIETETDLAADWLGGLHRDEQAPFRILVSPRADAVADLVYRPQILALGLGAERLTDPAEVIDLAGACLAGANLAPESVACVTSIALKAAEPALHAAARAFGVPARFFSAAELENEAPRLKNPSEVVYRETGCHGVAEGAALAATGADGVLIVEKTRSRHATCAIARAPRPIDSETIGRARGRLFIVGIGPGAAEARTPEADAAIRAASDLVGYGLYLDLLGDLALGKRLHGHDLGEEETRCRLALDLAALGRDVALVCSGDAGIYAMGSLVHELIDKGGNADWRRVETIGIPGISAMQVAAARIGAPLGHDFCAISLSDLLTPWHAIEARIRAAAEGDFVIAFYNPVSRRRRAQLEKARSILLAHRPADTPVVIARNLGRDGESVRVLKLAELSVDLVDMLSLVLVGSSATRLVERPDGSHSVYTPRGYDKKMKLSEAS
jgi:cobalt-precorrin 5A hydrolase / precorrin-3B C17-methyltransferase